MSKYRQFIFDAYEFDVESREFNCHYKIDQEFNFTERFKFDFKFADYDAKALDRALQTLFFLVGASYYKTYLPPQIVVRAGQIDQPLASFLNETYQKGLGEFFYVNKLDPKTAIKFPVNTATLSQISIDSNLDGLLVGLGGGKDSLTTVELLREKFDVMTWSLNHRSQFEPLVEKVGLPHAFVERSIDPVLLDLKNVRDDIYRGHIPISAIFAAMGSVVAILAGRRDVVVSNESSASEPNLHYQGVNINHQYSKSVEFERLYQTHLRLQFGESLRYYSALRPFTEVKVAEIFAKWGFEKYKDVFSSCNRAYILSSNHMSWCGHCPKCAFVFLVLTPFLSRGQLESLWGGKNLLLDPELEPTFRQLLGIEGDKPLECVGEIKESRAAMRLAQQIYPELKKYQFDLPEEYDFRRLSPHLMPSEVFDVIKQAA